MKYLLLIRWNADVHLTPAEDAVMQSSLEVWLKEMDGRGVRLQGNRLYPAEDAKLVRVRQGSLSVTDGPFIETKEQIAGFDLINCADLKEAVEVASKHPVARYGVVEIREFMED